MNRRCFVPSGRCRLRLMALLPLLLLLATTALGCPQKHVYHPRVATAFNQQEGASFGTRVVWLKYKRDAIDVLVRMYNRYPHPVQVTAAAITLHYNGQNARCSQRDKWLLRAGHELQRVLTFEFGRRMPPDGTADLTIAAIGDASARPPRPLPPATLQLPVRGWYY